MNALDYDAKVKTFIDLFFGGKIECAVASMSCADPPNYEEAYYPGDGRILRETPMAANIDAVFITGVGRITVSVTVGKKRIRGDAVQSLFLVRPTSAATSKPKQGD